MRSRGSCEERRQLRGAEEAERSMGSSGATVEAVCRQPCDSRVTVSTAV